MADRDRDGRDAVGADGEDALLQLAGALSGPVALLRERVGGLRELTGASGTVDRMTAAADRLAVMTQALTRDAVPARSGGNPATQPERVRSVAHDLRSPLTALLGFNALLELDEVDPAARRAVAEAGHAALLSVDASVTRWAPRAPQERRTTLLTTAVERARASAAPPGLDPPRVTGCPRTSLVVDATALRERLRLLLGLFVSAEPASVAIGCRPAPGGWHVTLTGPAPPASVTSRLRDLVAAACGAEVVPSRQDQDSPVTGILPVPRAAR